jgi:hypothetical protein
MSAFLVYAHSAMCDDQPKVLPLDKVSEANDPELVFAVFSTHEKAETYAREQTRKYGISFLYRQIRGVKPTDVGRTDVEKLK